MWILETSAWKWLLKSLSNHICTESTNWHRQVLQEARGRWAQRSLCQWPESRFQLLKWASYYRCNACICPSPKTSCKTDKLFTNPWHLLAVCFVSLPSLTTAQFSRQPRLACCFFSWKRGGINFLAAQATLTSDHLFQPGVLTNLEPAQLLHSQ